MPPFTPFPIPSPHYTINKDDINNHGLLRPGQLPQEPTGFFLHPDKATFMLFSNANAGTVNNKTYNGNNNYAEPLNPDLKRTGT
jgi:hypothetical protein